MSLEPHLLFYNSQILGKSGSLEKIFFSLLENSYDLFDFHVGSYPNYAAHWAEFSDATQRNLQLAYEHHGLGFLARTKLEGLVLSIHLSWEDLVDIGEEKEYALASAVSFQTASFRPEEDTSVIYSRQYLDFGKLLFSLIQPDFGWIDWEEPVGSTSPDEVKNLVIPNVYWANYFGRAYTKKYGVDCFLKSPAWFAEEIEEEGVLVVLSPILGIRTEHEQSEVEKHFAGIA